MSRRNGSDQGDSRLAAHERGGRRVGGGAIPRPPTVVRPRTFKPSSATGSRAAPFLGLLQRTLPRPERLPLERPHRPAALQAVVGGLDRLVVGEGGELLGEREVRGEAP